MGVLQIGTLALYVLAIVAIALWTRRQETAKDFLIGDRSIGTLATTASVAAVAGGLVLGGDTSLGFEFGLGALSLVAGSASGVALLGIFSGRIKAIADKHGFLTLPDYLFMVFDTKTGYVGALNIVVVFLFILAAQFIVCGQLLAGLTPLDYPTAVIGTGLFTLIYVLLGGYKAVVKTDLLQFAVMVFVFLVLVPVNIDFNSLNLEITRDGLSPLAMLSLYLSGATGVFVGADVWQRVYSARSLAVARRSFFLAATIWLLLGTSLVFLGIAAHGVSGTTADTVLVNGLYQILPAEFAGVATVGLLAALMSTIDTEVFLLASSVAKDFVARKRELNSEGMARTVRVAMVGVTLPAMAMAIFWSDLLGVLFLMFSCAVALFPVVFWSLIRPVPSNTAFWSIIVGLISILPSYLFGWVTPDTAPLIVLAGGTLTLLIGAMLTKRT